MGGGRGRGGECGGGGEGEGLGGVSKGRIGERRGEGRGGRVH